MSERIKSKEETPWRVAEMMPATESQPRQPATLEEIRSAAESAAVQGMVRAVELVKRLREMRPAPDAAAVQRMAGELGFSRDSEGIHRAAGLRALRNVVEAVEILRGAGDSPDPRLVEATRLHLLAAGLFAVVAEAEEGEPVPNSEIPDSEAGKWVM